MSRNCPLVKNPPPPVVVQNIIPVGEPQEDTIFIDSSINSWIYLIFDTEEKLVF